MGDTWTVDFDPSHLSPSATLVRRNLTASFVARRHPSPLTVRLVVRYEPESVRVERLVLESATGVASDDLRSVNLGEIRHLIVRLTLEVAEMFGGTRPALDKAAGLLEPRLRSAVDVPASRVGRPPVPAQRLAAIARLHLSASALPRGQRWSTFMAGLRELEGTDVSEGTAKWLLAVCRREQFLLKGPRPGPALKGGNK